jgi:hypothetical protein
LCRWHRRCKEPSTSAVSSVCNRKQTCELFYHLGDVVYYNGESKEYYPQFYEPYQHYQNPIFAIPGNHDGDPSPDGNEKSLDAFVRNFCATSKDVTPDAGEINKSPMVQPNVYWTLEAPYVTSVLEKYCDDHHGFMLVQVTPEKLFGEYWELPAFLAVASFPVNVPCMRNFLISFLDIFIIIDIIIADFRKYKSL